MRDELFLTAFNFREANQTASSRGATHEGSRNNSIMNTIRRMNESNPLFIVDSYREP